MNWWAKLVLRISHIEPTQLTNEQKELKDLCVFWNPETRDPQNGSNSTLLWAIDNIETIMIRKPNSKGASTAYVATATEGGRTARGWLGAFCSVLRFFEGLFYAHLRYLPFTTNSCWLELKKLWSCLFSISENSAGRSACTFFADTTEQTAFTFLFLFRNLHCMNVFCLGGAPQNDLLSRFYWARK